MNDTPTEHTLLTPLELIQIAQILHNEREGLDYDLALQEWKKAKAKLDYEARLADWQSESLKAFGTPPERPEEKESISYSEFRKLFKVTKTHAPFDLAVEYYLYFESQHPEWFEQVFKVNPEVKIFPQINDYV